MAFFQGPVPGHFAILQAKIGLKMAELDCFQNCSIWIIKKSQNLKELQGAPWPNQVLSMVLGEGPNSTIKNIMLNANCRVQKPKTPNVKCKGISRRLQGGLKRAFDLEGGRWSKALQHVAFIGCEICC